MCRPHQKEAEWGSSRCQKLRNGMSREGIATTRKRALSQHGYRGGVTDLCSLSSSVSSPAGAHAGRSRWNSYVSLLCHPPLLVSPIRGLVHSGYSLLSAASPRYYPRIYYLLGRGFSPRCVFLQGVLWEGRRRIWSIFPGCPPSLLFAPFLTLHTTRKSYEQGAYQEKDVVHVLV